MTRQVEFRGITRAGAAVTGRGRIGSVAAFVESKFRARWPELTVTVAGDEVGGIGLAPGTGRRTWWGEA